MSAQNATCEALWRASAEEGVAYADTDFPEVLLTRPELFDGSINQGQATHIRSSYERLPSGKWLAIEEDDGQGIFLGINRFMSWANSRSSGIHHRYGHGTKKYLTKAQPNYATSNWTLQWRNKAELSRLYTIRGPYRGLEMEETMIVDTTDTETLAAGGTRFTVEIDAALFHEFNTVERLFAAEKELIRSRHSQQLEDHQVQFTLTVSDGDAVKTENSIANSWTSLRSCLEANGAAKLIDEVYPIDGGNMHFAIYHYFKDQKRAMAAAFPLYGQRNMQGSRMHISLGGRMIEARPLYKFLGKTANHNDLNGYIGFMNFVPNSPADFERLPRPTTTKVKFSDECAAFQHVKLLIADAMEANKPRCGSTRAWKQLLVPAAQAIFDRPVIRRATPTVSPTESDDEEESMDADPIPTAAAQDPLTVFGICIDLDTRGIVQITATGHESLKFPGSALERDIMRKHAAKAATADAAYTAIVDLMAIFTR